MVEFAPTPVFIVKSRTEKEMRVSLRKILPDKRRMCHSVRLFFFFFFFCILHFAFLCQPKRLRLYFESTWLCA